MALIKLDKMIIDRSTTFLLGDWLIEPTLSRISRGEEIVRIDPRNMDVLVLLASRAGEVLSQTEIEKGVWGNVIVTSSSVYQAIAQLRRAFGETKSNPKYIETIARRGYRLVARVRMEPESPALGKEPCLDDAASSQSEATKPAEIPRTRRRLAHAGVAAAMSMSVIALLIGLSVLLQGTEPMAAIRERPTTSGIATVIGDGSRARLQLEAAIVSLGDGHVEEARTYLNNALETQLQISGENNATVASIYCWLARVHLWTGDLPAAEASARRALRISTFRGPTEGPGKFQSSLVLSQALLDAERYPEASSYAQQALSLARSLYGDGDESAEALDALANIRVAEGRLVEAEELARSAIQANALDRGADDSDTAYNRTVLAGILVARHEYKDGISEAMQVLRILENSARPDHPYVASTYQVLGEGLIQAGRFDEAEEVLSAAIQLWRNSNAPHWRVARASSALGEALLGQGRIDEAARELSAANRELQEARGMLQRSAARATQKRLEKLRLAQQRLASQNPEAATTILSDSLD